MRTLVDVHLLVYVNVASVRAAQAAVAKAGAMAADGGGAIDAVDLPRAASTFGTLITGGREMMQKVEDDSRQTAAGAQGHVLGPRQETRAATPTEAVAGASQEARHRDLSIIPWTESNLIVGEVAETVVLGSGRPVLPFPDVHQPARIDHVALARDGNRVASRAFADARPFLADGIRVTVQTASDETTLEPRIAGRLVGSPSRPGIAASAHVAAAGDRAHRPCAAGGLPRRPSGVGGEGGDGDSQVGDLVIDRATRGVLVPRRER